MNKLINFTLRMFIGSWLLIGLAAPLPGQALESSPTWVNATFDQDAQALALQGNTLWVATWGGVLRWNLSTGNYIKYTMADGISDNLTWDIAVDTQGRVWVATNWGLSMLEGHTWVRYDKNNSGIPGESVSEVMVGNDGRIWLHSRDVNGSVGMGITVFNGATWQTYTAANSDLVDDDIRSMGVDLNGHLWFGAWDGDVSEFDGATWTTYPNINLNYNEIFDLAIDSQNRKWFVSYISPVIMYDGTWHSYPPQNGCDTIPQYVAADASGLMWFSTLSGLCSFDGTTWTRYHTGNSGLAGNGLGDIATQGHTVWVGYNLLADGVTSFDGSTWRQYDTLRELPENIGSLGRAVEDRTWFGATPGVVVYNGSGWKAYDNTNSGLVGSCVDVITEDRNGHLWFAGGNCGGGLVEFDGTNWKQHRDVGAIPDPMVYAVAVGSDNRVWAGSRAGLSVYNGASWTTYNTSNSGLSNNLVTAIAVDGDDNVWPNCTTRFDGVNWLTYGTVQAAIEANYDAIRQPASEDFPCWLTDTAGRVWISKGTAGVSYYNGSTWVPYSLSAMGHSGLPYGWSARLAGEDASGNLWFILKDIDNAHGRLSRFNGSTWTPYTFTDGVIDPTGDMTVDHLGRVWFSAFRGFSLFYNSFQPTNALVTSSVGGILTSIDGSTWADFPGGAFASDMSVTLTPTQVSVPGNFDDIGHIFELSAVPSGTMTLAEDPLATYTITVGYTGQEVWTVTESALALYRWDGGQWVREPTSSVDVGQNRLTAHPTQLGLFAAMVKVERSYLPLIRR